MPGSPGGTGEPIDELVVLDARAGHGECHWREFLNLREAEWQDHSFDPVEMMPRDFKAHRFRAA